MSPLSVFAAAEESSHHPCVVTADAIWSFEDVAQRVAPVVAWLEARKEPDAPIALVPNLRKDSLIAMYAALEVGAPLIGIHPRLTTEERRALVPEGATLLDERWEAPPPGSSTPRPIRAHDPRRPLAELFTSGSSGRAKTVVLSRAAFLASAEASEANLGWRPDDRWLLSMPLAHVGGISVVIRCLAARVPVALAAWRKETSDFIREVDAVGATILSLVPTMLHRLLEETKGPVFSPRVRAVIVGGDALLPALRDEGLRRGVPILTTYGMTETCAQIATARPNEPVVGSGKPLRGVELRTVDGELHVRSRSLFDGYRADGKLTSARDADGWFATGDLGEIDADGYLHVRGRRSDLIISGGENVDPLEIERVVRAVEGVHDVRAFGVPDPRWGEVVAVAVIGQRDLALSIAETCAMRLAPHKRPRLVAFVATLPLGSSGKIERKKLAALLAGELASLGPSGTRTEGA